MTTAQTRCFRCYKELLTETDKEWLENDGNCPNCSTSLSVEDEVCWNCNKPAIQEDQILFCVACFDLISEDDEEDED